MVFPQWTKSSLGKWGFTLLIVPLFWWTMSVVIGAMTTLIIWLLAMALYIPLLLFIGGKIKPGAPTLPTHTEKLRRLVVWLGRIELGFFLFALYFFAYMIIFDDDFS
jgi:peptidoglycan/LPS O-acetylase OafA/YrhL